MTAIAAIKAATRGKRKYRVIAKVPDKSQPGGFRFVKYRTNRTDEFIMFLKRKFPGAYYANIYYAQGPHQGSIAYTWGSRKGLEKAK